MDARFPHPLLVADIGGTNARFAVATSPGAALSPVLRLPSGGHADFADTVVHAIHAGGFPRPRSFLAAVAGPVTGHGAELTNAATASGKLALDGAALAQTLGLEQGLLLNDFEALSLALPFLTDTALLPIGAGRGVPGPLAVVGPGTGLGVGALVAADGRYAAIASEGGHVSLGPESPAEWALWPHLDTQTCSAEDILSGRGLLRVYRAECKRLGQPAPHDTAAAIVAEAHANPQGPARTAALLFLNLLGRFAGDVALTYGAIGGVFLGGGMTPRLQELIPLSDMRQRFQAKGQASRFMADIPLALILRDDAALLGLAAVGATPDRFHLTYASRCWRAA